ncbi:MAG TPA: hypothetical protein VHO72_15530 [Bacteroidales bacterium]|nr:hypothetical protein [Bacteroidales bacterium]
MKYLIIGLLFFSTAAFAQEEVDIPDYNTEIQENYPVWVPGKVLGVPVRTDNNVRIRIVNE